MSSRTVELITTPDAVSIRHVAPSGPEFRLRSALLRWDGVGGGPAGAILAGAAWEGQGGAIHWGWPDDTGQFHLRPGPDRPEVCSVLPPALSLALAFRRSGAEMGARVVVIGEGFLARVARAVASGVGCRATTLAGRPEETPLVGTPADLVIETTGSRENLDRGVELCRDWGRVFSMAGALTAVPLDYYPHVHRRALTVVHVPERPVLRLEEEEIANRSVAYLAEVVRGLSPAADRVLDTRVLPEGTAGRLTWERSGWGLLLVDG